MTLHTHHLILNWECVGVTGERVGFTSPTGKMRTLVKHINTVIKTKPVSWIVQGNLTQKICHY